MSKAISDILFDFKASRLFLEPTFYMSFLFLRISPSSFITVNPGGPESVFLKLRSGYDWIDRLVFRSIEFGFCRVWFKAIFVCPSLCDSSTALETIYIR